MEPTNVPSTSTSRQQSQQHADGNLLATLQDPQISMDQVNSLLNEGRQQQQFAQFVLQQQPQLLLNPGLTQATFLQPAATQQTYNPYYRAMPEQQQFQNYVYAQQQQVPHFVQQPPPQPQSHIQESHAEDILHLILEQQHRIQQLEQELEKSKQFVASLQTYVQKLEAEREKVTKKSSRYWTQEEHQKFLHAVEMFGRKDVKAIAQYVGTRSTTQVRTHAQKFYAKVEREKRKREDGDDGFEDESSQDEIVQPPAKVAAV